MACPCGGRNSHPSRFDPVGACRPLSALSLSYLCHMSVQRVSKGYPMGREAPFPRRRHGAAGAYRAACPKAPRDAKSSISPLGVVGSYARARYKIRCADKKSGFFEFLLGKVWRVGKVGVPLQPQTREDAFRQGGRSDSAARERSLERFT